ncbi:MAG: ABC transporter permease subunit [Alphaproteobacteria bacterium]|nr:ABC transporter permease subunit [Alphaproteobacteria bacterium]
MIPSATANALRRALVVGPPYLWLLAFFVAPFAIVIAISLTDPAVRAPPYTPLLAADGAFQGDLDNYATVLGDSYYAAALLDSLRIAAVATFFCLLLGYPMAYAIARAAPAAKLALLLAVMLPFWTSFLIRVYAWIGLLNSNGHINEWLIALGVIEEPLALLYTDFAVYIGIVYAYLPFMVLPIFAVLERLDRALLDAAADLGARPWQAFVRVTLPLSFPGIAAGSLLVFIPAIGEFVIPELLGGSDFVMVGRVLWTEAFSNRDWPMAAAVAVALLVLVVAPVAWLDRKVAPKVMARP